MLGKILCFMGLHKVKRIEEGRGVAGGQRCLREGCDWKTDPIEWPRA